jgi:uncharacterized repeat protein (TIGR03803 family)
LLEAANGVFYGTTFGGGASNLGTIFRLSITPPPPELSITPDGGGGYFILCDGVSGPTYRLQRAPSLTDPWTTGAPQTAPSTGLIEFHDLSPLPGRAFYRAVQP